MGEKKFELRNSGDQKEQFQTGSVRDSRDGKGRFDLIPTGPLRRLARIYEEGGKRYGDGNWKKGQSLMRYMDSALRHINCAIAGEPTEDHLAQCSWNCFAFMWTLNEIEAGRLPKELDDRPAPEPQYVVGLSGTPTKEPSTP